MIEQFGTGIMHGGIYGGVEWIHEITWPPPPPGKPFPEYRG